MIQQHTTSLGRQLRVVLLSYLTRPGFRWGFVGIASAFALHYFLVGTDLLLAGHRDLASISFLEIGGMLAPLLLYASVVGVLIIFFLHAREQLMGSSAHLMPNMRDANVVVAAILFGSIAFLLSAASIGLPHLLFFGVFIVVVLFLTLISWAVCNPWLAPIPIILLLLSFRNIYAYSAVSDVVRSMDLSEHLPSNKWVAQLWESQIRETYYLRTAVFLADLVALVILERLARPGKYTLRLPTITLSRTLNAAKPVFNNARHPFVDSALARSFHRRFAVHDWRAAGVAALGIAGLSVWLCFQFPSDAASVLTMLLALLPGALVAIGWRERWGILDFESLYPVSRRDFVTDMAAGLLLDAAEFWVATVAAALIACLCMRLPGLHDIHFWAALFIGAMLQLVWIAGVFFVGQRRQTISYVAGLAPFALAIFITVEAVWRQAHPLPLKTIMLIAIAELLGGIAIFLMTWASLQRAPRTRWDGRHRASSLIRESIMQQSRRQLSLLDQLRVVLMSYLTRPGLQWAALAAGAGLVIYGAAVVMARANGHSSPHGDPVATLIAVFGALAISSGVVGFLLIFLFHARQQLIGWPARTFPHTRTPNLIVAGVAFPLFAASFALLTINPYSHLFGLFILYFGVLILAGYAFARPWLLVVLIVGGWLTFKYTSLELRLNAMTVDREYVDWHRGSVAFPVFEMRTVSGATPDVHEKEVRLQTAALLARLEFDYELLRTQRLATFLGEVLALLGLGALARPSHPLHGTILRCVRRGVPGTDRVPKAIAMREHSFITSRFSRSLHRRFAAHDWRAGVVAALAMAVLSIWFNLQFRVDTAIPMLALMLAFLPGALVAVGWRERWPTFEFESLYPVSRREQISDMAVGLIIDVAEFWIASVIAVTIVCAALRTAVLHDPRFWVALLAGGMMQFLWLGGIFFVGQRRQLASYIAGLTPGAIAMFLTLEALWQTGRPMPATAALLIALIEMGVGLSIFLLTWKVVQRGPRTNDGQLPGYGRAS